MLSQNTRIHKSETRIWVFVGFFPWAENIVWAAISSSVSKDQNLGYKAGIQDPLFEQSIYIIFGLQIGTFII